MLYDPLDEMKAYLSLIVYVADKPRNLCRSCKLSIQAGEIEVYDMEAGRIGYFHLNCFKPINVTRMEPDHYRLQLTDPLHIETFQTWLSNWNKNFPIPSTPAKLFAKPNTNAPQIKSRILKEIFKFLSPKELILVSQVCKEWYEISLNGEVWCFLVNRDFPKAVFCDSWINSYFYNYNNACVECGEIKENGKHCPILDRMICKECRAFKNRFSDKYGLIPLKAIKKLYNLNDNWINKRKLKYFKTSRNQKVTYNFLLWEKINETRYIMKGKILENLKKNCKDEQLIGYIKNIDLMNLYRQDYVGEDFPAKRATVESTVKFLIEAQDGRNYFSKYYENIGMKKAKRST